jgi:Na+-driven multidrug efflux pump
MVLLWIVRATGAVMAPLLIATLSMLVVWFPLAEMLLNRWQADAIWWSFPISSALDVVLAGLYYKYGGWRKARLEIPIPVEALGTHSTEDW